MTSVIRPSCLLMSRSVNIKGKKRKGTSKAFPNQLKYAPRYHGWKMYERAHWDGFLFAVMEMLWSFPWLCYT